VHKPLLIMMAGQFFDGTGMAALPSSVCEGRGNTTTPTGPRPMPAKEK